MTNVAKYLKQVFLLIAILAGGISCIAASDYLSQYGSDPIRAKMVPRAGGTKDVVLTGVVDGMIDYQGATGDSSGSIPLNGKTKFKHSHSGDVKNARSAAISGDFEGALEKLRPVAYAMLPYLQSNEEVTDFQPVVQMLVQTLLAAEKYDELDVVLSASDVRNLSPQFTLVMFSAIETLMEKGYAEGALQVFSGISIEKHQKLIPQMMELSNSLLGPERIGAFADFYTKVIELSNDEEEKSEAKLMLTYVDLLSGKAEAARAGLNQFSATLDSSNALYPLYKMIAARILLLDNKPKEALLEAADGYYNLDYSRSWSAEALYSLAEAYAVLENTKAVKSIHDELTISFPNSKWTQKAGAFVLEN